MRRICICAFDICEKPFQYQKFLLKEMVKTCECLILVYNGKQIEFELPLNTIVCSDVKGFDIDKWRYAISSYYSKICEYDELILLNDSFFGPIRELDDMFQDMEKRKIDFWGITEHKEIYNGTALIADRFVQRYFMVFNKSVISHPSFYKFWNKLKKMRTYQETENKFEFIFTRMLCDVGLKYDVYCSSLDIEPIEKIYATSHVLIDTAWLINNRKLPFVPTYVFCIERKIVLNYGNGSNCTDIMRYLKNQTSYDVEMIWEYLLKTQNIYDLYVNLELNEIFPIHPCINQKTNAKKVAVFVYLFYQDNFRKNVCRLKSIPKSIHLYIITDSISKVEMIKKIVEEQGINARVVPHLKKGREWGALLLTIDEQIKQYDYFCFLHDKQSVYLAYKSIGRDFEDILWDNLIESEEYIESIINYFEENSRVGLIVPPVATHSIYYGESSDFWTICYEETLKLATRIGINISKIEKDKPPITIGSCFWCKTDALKKLFNVSFTEDDFPNEPLNIDGTINHCLERILPYIAQDKGYFTMCAMSRKHFKTFYTNNEYISHKLNNSLKQQYQYCTVNELIDIMDNDKKKKERRKIWSFIKNRWIV